MFSVVLITKIQIFVCQTGTFVWKPFQFTTLASQCGTAMQLSSILFVIVAVAINYIESIYSEFDFENVLMKWAANSLYSCFIFTVWHLCDDMLRRQLWQIKFAFC